MVLLIAPMCVCSRQWLVHVCVCAISTYVCVCVCVYVNALSMGCVSVCKQGPLSRGINRGAGAEEQKREQIVCECV